MHGLLGFRGVVGWVWLGCALSIGALGGCSPAYLEQRADEPQSAADAVRAADLSPRFPSASRRSAEASEKRGGFLSFGSDAPVSARAAEVGGEGATEELSPQEGSNGYTLNFDNSPVANVAKVVLGDLLSLRYTIDPRAQGAVSLSSTRPIPKRDLLFVLESALRANNLGMIREAGGYRIVPTADGGPFGPTDRANSADAVSPGYGTTVIPLTYVSAPTLVRLLEGFAMRPGTVRADPSGRLMLVVGTGDERRSALETVRQFDVDWLRGQSVGLYPIHNGASAAVAAELEKILDSGEAGLGHGLVKLQDVTAQNAVLVVATRPQLLQAASRWIERLDSPNVSGSAVHVYKVHYGDAKQIAQLLNAMFMNSGPSGDSDAGQLAPGAGAKHLSTAERLTGGRPQTGAAAPSLGAPGATGSAAPNATGAQGGGASQFGGLQSCCAQLGFRSGRSAERRRIGASRRAYYRRCRRQFAADLCKRRKLSDHRARGAADRPAEGASCDRRDDRRSDAQRSA